MSKIGLILGVIAAIPTGGLSLLGGVVGGAVGGGVVGSLFHRHLGLSDADRARIGKELDGGKAAVGVLVEADEAAAFTAKLAELGGQPETHEVTDEGVEKAAAAQQEPHPFKRKQQAELHPLLRTQPRALLRLQ